MVRVAYCFYGQPRRVEEGYTTVESLIRRHPDVQFDFFYHTWYDSSKPKENDDSWVSSIAKEEAAKNKKIQVPTYVTKASKK